MEGRRMRNTALILGAIALLSLGATGSSSCLSSLLPVVTPAVTVSIHAINEAYEPVAVQLVNGDTDSDKNAADTPSAAFRAAVDIPIEIPTTQPAGGSAVDPGQDVKGSTLLCGAISESISAKATIDNGEESSDTEASSPELQYGGDFVCGDRVNFIIRPAAMAGIVVGYEVVSGGAV